MLERLENVKYALVIAEGGDAVLGTANFVRVSDTLFVRVVDEADNETLIHVRYVQRIRVLAETEYRILRSRRRDAALRNVGGALDASEAADDQ